MIVKCGRKEFDLNENDRIMFNGACYQIVTRKIYKEWHEHSPLLAKGKAEKMIKDGLLVLHKVVDGKVKFPLKYYKIKVEGD